MIYNHQIHRQCEGSGIIQFAEDIRLRRGLAVWQYSNVKIHHNQSPTIADAMLADVILCGYNHRRVTINKNLRKRKGFTGTLQAGEKVICLKNNINLGVFNGQIFDVIEVKQQDDRQILAKCADNGDERDLVFWRVGFGKRKLREKDMTGIDMQDAVVADYGYAITVHKSQGSEWDNVIVIDQSCPAWDAVKWRYTAITRAVRKLRYYFP